VLTLAGHLTRLCRNIGQLVAWLTVAMVAVTLVVVILRYVFDLGWIWLQESVTWMHAAVFMLAAAYTLAEDEHVRVDIVYRGLRPRHQAVVDIVGCGLLLIPFCVYLVWASWDYAAISWAIREGSREAGGLPYPFTSLLKTLIPATAILLACQGLAMIIERAGRLLGWAPDAPSLADRPRGGAA
jgi:TRAP-type mannitol/chloroaromatic compound transport system permease small subunit